MALLPPGAVGEVWPYTLPGGRAPGPQDRGFLVVRGDPRELRLGAHGAPRGADEKPLRRKRSAALQPEPIQVYGQVSGRPPPAPLGSLLSLRCRTPASILGCRFPGAGTAGTSWLAFVFFPSSLEYNHQHLNRLDLSSFLSILAKDSRALAGCTACFPMVCAHRWSFWQVSEGCSLILRVDKNGLSLVYHQLAAEAASTLQ